MNPMLEGPAKPIAFNCPSCGAPHEIYNPGVIMKVCEYCRNAIYWDEEKIKLAGAQSILDEGFTRLYRGAAGTLFQRRFMVLGRIRYSFGRGFWDEWFLEFQNGKTEWLSEDNHELAIEKQIERALNTPFTAFAPGKSFKLEGKTFVVEEAGEAECIGVEGDLPVVIQTGEKYPYVDASSPDGRYTLSIEYDEDPPTIFQGHWLKYVSVRLDEEAMEW